MNREEVRQIIKEELASLILTDRYVFEKNIQIFDKYNIQLGRTTGTKIGTEGYTDANNPGQKLGFFNQTPTTQPLAIDDPSGGGAAGVDSSARGAINSILDALQALGLIKT